MSGRARAPLPRRGLLLLAVLAACKKDDPEQGVYDALLDPEVSWIEQGTGAANTLPLHPMTSGMRRETRSERIRWFGPIDAGQDDLTAVDVNDAFWGVMSAQLYRHTPDGIALHALDHHLDPEALSILVLPDEVRLAMTWDSAFGDGSVHRRSVVAHTTRDTLLGPVSAWDIAEVVDGNNVREHWYGEGIGPLGAESADDVLMVVPESSLDHVEQPFDPIALEPILDPFGRPVDPQGLPEALRVEDRDGRTRVVWHGFRPRQAPYDTDHFPTDCYELGDWAKLASDDCPTEDAVPSTAALLDTTRAQLGFEPGAIGVWTVDGEARYLKYGQDPGHVGTQENEFWVASGSVDGPLTRLDNGIPHFLSQYQGGDVEWSWLTVGPTAYVAGQTVSLAVILADGRVFEVRISDTRIEGFELAGLLPGALTFVQDGDEIRAYGLSYDGRLFGTRSEDGHTRVWSYGDVWLEDDTSYWTAVSAFIDPNDPTSVLVALRQDPWVDAQGTWEATPLYGMSLLRGTLTREPVVSTGPATLGLGLGTVMGGIEVCWQPTDNALPTTGWTVQGAPATVYGPGGPDDSCAVLVPDGDPAGAEVIDVAGPVPGMGRLRFGFADRPLHDLGAEASTTPDGGAVALWGTRFDQYGIQISGQGRGLTPEHFRKIVRDAGAYGLYVWLTTDEYVWNEGGDLDIPDGHEFRGLVEGGGVLVASGTTYRVVDPSGTFDVPTAQAQPILGLSGVLVLQDGRICWAADRKVSCVDETGAVATQTTTIRPETDYQLWPLQDGSVVFGGVELDTNTYATWHFDPDDLQVALYDARSLYSPITAADGQVYGVFRQTPDEDELVELTASGPVPIATMGDGAWTPVGLPLATQFLLYSSRGEWRRVAR